MSLTLYECLYLCTFQKKAPGYLNLVSVRRANNAQDEHPRQLTDSNMSINTIYGGKLRSVI